MSYSTIDLRDLAAERSDLFERSEAAKSCAHCGEPISRIEHGREPWRTEPARDAKGRPVRGSRTKAALAARALCTARQDADGPCLGHEPGATPLDADETARLAALEAIGRHLDSAEDEPTAIDADGFEAYAEELAEDTGSITRGAPWPLCHIDWSAAADALRVDYDEFEFEGTTYLVRSC